MTTVDIVEAWNGPGRKDGVITDASPKNNAVHLSSGGAAFEHWYFDAQLDDGHTVVAFLNKRRPEDPPRCRPWVEIIIYAPDGTRREIAKKYPRRESFFSEEKCDVRIGKNTARVSFPEDGGLPSYHVFIEEEDVTFDLTFTNELQPWMPGRGETHFGAKHSFGWIVGAPRASVTGTVKLGATTIDATGRGYADHNWGVGDMKRVIDCWHWGRLYVDDYSLLYASVKTQEKFGSHAIQPLMLAHNDSIVLSTGEVEFTTGPTAFDEVANRSYPTWISLVVPGSLELRLDVQRVLHAHDFLDDIPVVGSKLLRPLAYRLIGHPGYFRFQSRFELTIIDGDQTHHRTGTTLHELVALR